LLAGYFRHFVKYGKADSPEANLSDLHRLQRETTPAGEAEAVFIGLFPVSTRPLLGFTGIGFIMYRRQSKLKMRLA
jgi:hypothetical protein